MKVVTDEDICKELWKYKAIDIERTHVREYSHPGVFGADVEAHFEDDADLELVLGVSCDDDGEPVGIDSTYYHGDGDEDQNDWYPFSDYESLGEILDGILKEGNISTKRWK